MGPWVSALSWDNFFAFYLQIDNDRGQSCFRRKLFLQNLLICILLKSINLYLLIKLYLHLFLHLFLINFPVMISIYNIILILFLPNRNISWDLLLDDLWCYQICVLIVVLFFNFVFLITLGSIWRRIEISYWFSPQPKLDFFSFFIQFISKTYRLMRRLRFKPLILR